MLKPVSVTPAPPRPFVAQTATAASPVTSAGFGAVLDAAQRAVVKTIAQPGGKAGLPNAAVSSGKPGEIPAATAGAVSQPVADPAEPEATGHPGRQTDPVVGQSGTKQAPPAAPHAVAPSASPEAAAAVVMPASFPEAAAVPSQAAALAAQVASVPFEGGDLPSAAGAEGSDSVVGRGLASPFLLTAPDRSRLNGKTPDSAEASDSATAGQADTAVSEPDPAAAGQSMKSTAPGLVSGSQPTALVSPIYADAGREGGPVSPTDQQAIAAATTAVTAPLAGPANPVASLPAGTHAATPIGTAESKPGPVSGAKSPASPGPPAAGPGQNKTTSAPASVTAVNQTASSNGPAAAYGGRTKSTAAPVSAITGSGGSAVSIAAQPTTDATTRPATVADTLQRMTGIGGQAIARSDNGTASATPGLPVDDTGDTAAGSVPAATGDVDVRAPESLPGAAAALALSGVVTTDIAGSPGVPTNPANRRSAGDAASSAVSGASGTAAAEPQAVQGQNGQVASASGLSASSSRPISADASSVPSVAAQVAPAVVAMARGQSPDGRLSVSITPDQLGQVHITVERASDGTTAIHVAAEQLTTLDLLRQDQATLSHALDQAGVGQEGHSLSFSWEGGGGGMPGWDPPGDQSGDGQTANIANPYTTEEAVSAPSAAAAARGGIDVTA